MTIDLGSDATLVSLVRHACIRTLMALGYQRHILIFPVQNVETKSAFPSSLYEKPYDNSSYLVPYSIKISQSEKRRASWVLFFVCTKCDHIFHGSELAA